MKEVDLILKNNVKQIKAFYSGDAYIETKKHEITLKKKNNK